jgi:hypothetical protein
MAQRNVHYEAAFEDYLRAKGLPYVAVDEAKKAIFAGVSIKSFDFLVYSTSGPNLLVDVKGRKFPDSGPARGGGPRRAWENWVTREDLNGLQEWEKVFGGGFQAVLVFAYWLQGPPQRAPFQDVHLFRQKHYAFVVVRLADYLAAARPRSAKWQTVTMPAAQFARLASDVASFL